MLATFLNMISKLFKQPMSKDKIAFKIMLDWLCSDNVIQARDGHVISWFNPTHPGYAYPEAAGLLLSLLVAHDLGKSIQKSIVLGLTDDASKTTGLGKEDREYLFDTSIVLSALLAYVKTGELLPEPELPNRLFQFITYLLSEKRATNDEAIKQSERWSLGYNCHMLKVVICLAAYYEQYSDPKCIDLIEDIIHDFLPLYQDGYFYTDSQSSNIYIHANCYAVEGLICLQQKGFKDFSMTISKCAEWLATIQQADGGIPSWYDEQNTIFTSHADTTAQAVRIWSFVDRGLFQAEISFALDFLKRLQSPEGGLYYCSESKDINTWATIFAVQAIQWATEDCINSSII